MVSKQGGGVLTTGDGIVTVICDGDEREATALLVEDRTRRFVVRVGRGEKSAN